MLNAIMATAFMAGTQATDFSITIDVLVLNYDPLIESRGGQRLHSALGWADPRELAVQYAADIEEISGGFVRLNIKQWRDLDEWPKKIDGFRYTDRTYLDVISGRTAAHQPDESDYPFMFRSQGVYTAMDSGKFDELWVFSFPYAGHWEAAMAGPKAFFINGGVYDHVACKTRFAIMGFSYERGVAEMLHNTSHRTENHMARVFGRWQSGVPGNAWEKFSAYEKTSPGYASVGNCHFPPNAEADYDYGNPRTVMSSADDWFDYPKLDGAKSPVNAETWGGPDYQRNYLKWWFNHLPKNKGVDSTGRQNNWWKYIYRFNSYDESGR
jgi:hypothetical protein